MNRTNVPRKKKESNKEQNEITVAAIAHCTPAPNSEISESIVEDDDILPDRITYQKLTIVAERESSLAYLVKH